ncbi:MAG TPA: glycoside hydrolase family 3 C-terminal domain-containing protein [Terracidiphilus sp.]|nr:glycoside hydrolase family 3 C-terminal domain-containing protein [Terracidiphilus sp.]
MLKNKFPAPPAVVFLSALFVALSMIVMQPAKARAQAATAARPWMNKAFSPRKRAELLVHAMTLDEKVEQIHMSGDRAHPREIPGIPRLGLPTFKITNGPAGAGPGDSREEVPATALPSALALSATWDPTLADEFGEVAGAETADLGEQMIEAPGVDIVRVPQNGRNFEYFGEDPYLSGRMAIPEIQAIQNAGVIAEVKHYAANNQEADRKTINELIGLRALHEIFLPAFHAAIVDGHAGAVMCAYPSVNGQFNCENTYLLKDVLRGEWGFQGFVQSDYTATHSTIPAALAGLDLEMKHDAHYDANMKAAVEIGALPMSVLDGLLIHRYRTMFALGIFDREYPVKPIPEEHDGQVAREIADAAAVLLKNQNDQLPLMADALKSIALIGPYAGEAMTGGGGSSHVKPLYTVSPLDGLKKDLPADATVTCDDGAQPAAAAALAAKSDVAIVMVGNKDSEGHDRPSLSLPDNQDALIEAVAAANPHTIVVLKTGGPVLMPWLDKVPAVLEAWYPGEEDGDVVADLLFGKVDPSGKLTVTFPKAEGDTPAHTPEEYPGVDGTVIYREGLKVGYRWYDAEKIEPLFPFGFGLSYTTFRLADFHVSPEDAGGMVHVGLSITNTGKVAGADVAQVYVAFPAAAGEPPHQLKGFARVFLQPGESRHILVTLTSSAFSVWDTAANRWRVEPGRFGILAGDSSRNLPLQGSVEIRAQAR